MRRDGHRKWLLFNYLPVRGRLRHPHLCGTGQVSVPSEFNQQVQNHHGAAVSPNLHAALTTAKAPRTRGGASPSASCLSAPERPPRPPPESPSPTRAPPRPPAPAARQRAAGAGGHRPSAGSARGRRGAQTPRWPGRLIASRRRGSNNVESRAGVGTWGPGVGGAPVKLRPAPGNSPRPSGAQTDLSRMFEAPPAPCWGLERLHCSLLPSGSCNPRPPATWGAGLPQGPSAAWESAHASQFIFHFTCPRVLTLRGPLWAQVKSPWTLW